MNTTFENSYRILHLRSLVNAHIPYFEYFFVLGVGEFNDRGHSLSFCDDS